MPETGASVLTATLLPLLGGVVPIFLGILVSKLAYDLKALSMYAVPISLGIVLSTFYDLLEETAGLQVGASNHISQIATVLLFLIGMLILTMFPMSPRTRRGQLITYALVFGWALGLGLHGFGEGIVIGYGFISNQAAYADVTQILSYGLHKIGEGFTLGTLLAIFNKRFNVSWIVAGLTAALPVGIGGALGFLTDSAEISTYAFAIGAGFAAYFIIQFSKLLPDQKRMIYFAVAAGFLFMYLAGLLHQF